MISRVLLQKILTCFHNKKKEELPKALGRSRNRMSTLRVTMLKMEQNYHKLMQKKLHKELKISRILTTISKVHMHMILL